jgi:hypothetical protein
MTRVLKAAERGLFGVGFGEAGRHGLPGLSQRHALGRD